MWVSKDTASPLPWAMEQNCACLHLSILLDFLRGRNLSSVTDDTVAFSRQLTEDSQFRWLGPEKGVIHLAAAALINAVWDLYARTEGKPLWKRLADCEPEQIVRSIDFNISKMPLLRMKPLIY